MADSPDLNVSHTLVRIYIASTLGLCVAQTCAYSVLATRYLLNIKNVNIETQLLDAMEVEKKSVTIQSSLRHLRKKVFSYFLIIKSS